MIELDKIHEGVYAEYKDVLKKTPEKREALDTKYSLIFNVAVRDKLGWYFAKEDL
jgi:hypothetical protein